MADATGEIKDAEEKSETNGDNSWERKKNPNPNPPKKMGIK